MLMHSHKNLTVLHFLGGDYIRQILWKFSSLLPLPDVWPVLLSAPQFENLR